MAADTVNFTKDVFNDKFPEERKDQFIYRLKKVSEESTPCRPSAPTDPTRSLSSARSTRTTARP